MLEEPLFSGIVPFVEVAESSSFRAAAERLGVSTAAVSKAIGRLEERLGVKLLVRTSRSVALTPEGAQFRERCREVIEQMRSAREQLQQSRRQPSGELHVSLSLILGSVIVPRLVELNARFPKLSFRFSMSDRVSRLLEEGVDVAVRLGARKDSSLVSKLLLSPRWVTLASPAFIARQGLPTEPRALAGFNCVRFVGPNGKPRDFWFRSTGDNESELMAVRGNLLIDQGERLVDAALSGLGVVQVLDFMVPSELAAGRLVEILPRFSAPGPPLAAVTTPERSKAPGVRAFMSFLGEVFRAPR